MKSTVISLAAAAAIAALLVATNMLLTPGSDPAVSAVGSAEPSGPAPAPPASATVAALEAPPGPEAGAVSEPLNREQAEARLEQIERQLEAMESEVVGIDDMSEQDAEALFDRVEPLLEQLAEAELALEAAIEAENSAP